MSVRSWPKELNEELCNIRLAFVQTKQQKYNLREITKIMKERCNDRKAEYDRKMFEKSSLTLYQK